MTQQRERHNATIQLSPAILKRAAGRPGAIVKNGHLRLSFFGTTYTLSTDKILGPDATIPTRPVAEVLQDYVVHAPVAADGGDRLVSFRELEGSGPLAVSFANNTNKTITAAFSGRRNQLVQAAAALSGIAETDTDGYDLRIRFQALPGLPLHLFFNDAEANFPARCTPLLPAAIETCLGRQAIFTLGTFLCGRLAGSTYTAG